jgi:hypothetical protein
MNAVARGCLAGALVLLLSKSADAQESKSAALAKQLTAALDAAKLDSVAAKDPSGADVFVAALYFPGAELLVVSAKYTAPTLLVDRIGKKEYREVYIDLNSASVPDSKIFVEDLGADGLKSKHDENQPFDSYEAAGKRTAFDGEWKKQKLTEQDYLKAFSAADEKYSQMLRTLLAQLKQTS